MAEPKYYVFLCVDTGEFYVEKSEDILGRYSANNLPEVGQRLFVRYEECWGDVLGLPLNGGVLILLDSDGEICLCHPAQLHDVDPKDAREASEAIHGKDRFYVEAPGTDQTAWHVQDHIGNDVFRCESESEARRWIVKHSTEG